MNQNNISKRVRKLYLELNSRNHTREELINLGLKDSGQKINSMELYIDECTDRYFLMEKIRNGKLGYYISYDNPLNYIRRC